MANDIDPVIAKIVSIALGEVDGADFTIIRTSEDEKGVCAALRSPNGREHSVCIDWNREDGELTAVELFERLIRRLM